MIFTNQHSDEIEVIGLGDVLIRSLTINESTSTEIFRLHYKTLSVTILNDDNSLYDSYLIGTQITVKRAGNVVFDGIVSSQPSSQAYNHKYEDYTIYADDYLTTLKSMAYTKASATIKEIFDEYLPDYTYTPANDIDITKAIITLEALTDTTITVANALLEVCKLLNVSVYDKKICSPIVGQSEPILAHYATTNLGLKEAILSAEIKILEESDKGGNNTVSNDNFTYTWLPLQKELVYGYQRNNGNNLPGPTEPVVQYNCLFEKLNKFDTSTGKLTNIDDIAYQGIAQYYRLGKVNNWTYDNDHCYEIQMATSEYYYVDDKLNGERPYHNEPPSGSPSFSEHLLIYPYSLNIGGSQTDTSVNATTFEDVDGNHVYRTSSYNITVPPITTYKPCTYLLINFEVQMYPVVVGSFVDGMWKSKYRLFSTLFGVKGYSFGQNHTDVRFKVRFYEGDTLKLQRTIKSKFDIKDNEYVDNCLNLKNQINTNWNYGINSSGYAVEFVYEIIKNCDRMEVDFCGFGGLYPILYNSKTSSGGLTCYSNDKDWNVTLLEIGAYTIDMDFELASGYLADDEEEIEVEPEITPLIPKTHYFYWEQDKGSGSMTLQNRLNSLVTTPTKSSVTVDGKYLEKVNSYIYSGPHLSEVIQLATIIDQLGVNGSQLLIDTFDLNRFVTFKDRNYRLTGYNYDCLTGVYRCSYLELQPTTNIEYV